jgi:hypothetical protein
MPRAKTNNTTRRFTPQATLAALGLKLRALKLFAPVQETVKIKQKTVKHTPADKLYDAFIALLAGAHGLCEINTRLRSDEALQRAFGRAACAEQSVVQETLDRCTTENVAQLMAAVDTIFRRHSRAYRHDYAAGLQLLDIDLTGLPCGRQAEWAAKGYFGRGDRHRRGRQLGRVLASHYEEVVSDRLYPGNWNLPRTLRWLVETAEATLELDEAKRARTVLRLDAGGGSLDDVNWLLGRGYQVHCKDYSGARAAALAATVVEWFDDPRREGRQLGWVRCEPLDYVRPLRRLALRLRKRNGQWYHAVLLSSLTPGQVAALLDQPPAQLAGPAAQALAYAHLYDLRGGTVEIEIKEDKQGLGMTRRNKKKVEAQQVVMLLGSLAHNVIVWAREWLSAAAPRVKELGVARFVRDLLRVSGAVESDAAGQAVRVVLNRAAPAARRFGEAFRQLLLPEQVALILGET